MKQAECTLNEQVEKVLKDFHAAKKPIGYVNFVYLSYYSLILCLSEVSRTDLFILYNILKKDFISCGFVFHCLLSDFAFDYYTFHL